jgi:hypothetical protein
MSNLVESGLPIHFIRNEAILLKMIWKCCLVYEDGKKQQEVFVVVS